MGQWQEFKDFLREYNVVAMAIAFMMGVVAKDLVQSFVNNVVMPFVTPFIAADSWEAATVALGPVNIGWGAFTAAAVEFVVIAFVVFLVAKKVLKEEKVAKR